ncbi:MAG TPA: hypothetical protein VI457_07780 [Methylococcaceae bacterium]|nr:hypothetical protein [Methylococcaceae bacterium]
MKPFGRIVLTTFALVLASANTVLAESGSGAWSEGRGRPDNRCNDPYASVYNDDCAGAPDAAPSPTVPQPAYSAPSAPPSTAPAVVAPSASPECANAEFQVVVTANDLFPELVAGIERSAREEQDLLNGIANARAARVAPTALEQRLNEVRTWRNNTTAYLGNIHPQTVRMRGCASWQDAINYARRNLGAPPLP